MPKEPENNEVPPPEVEKPKKKYTFTYDPKSFNLNNNKKEEPPHEDPPEEEHHEK